MLQRTATHDSASTQLPFSCHGNTLHHRHTATHCNTLQHTTQRAHHCHMRCSQNHSIFTTVNGPSLMGTLPPPHTRSDCNSHTHTNCDSLQLTATHCTTRQHTATHCNPLQPTAAHCDTLQFTVTQCNSLHCTASVPPHGRRYASRHAHSYILKHIYI